MKQFNYGSVVRAERELEALHDIRELLYLLATQAALESRPIGWDERLKAFEERRMH